LVDCLAVPLTIPLFFSSFTLTEPPPVVVVVDDPADPVYASNPEIERYVF
jgi:hypothetical protein